MADSDQHPTIEIIGSSRIMDECREFIALASRSDVNVLLTGETGVGKELFARAIHQQSHRVFKSFVIAEPSTITEHLVDSYLFGHEKGSYSGAEQQVKGHFEIAHEGTLFIDEVGTLPQAIQLKILRAVEHKTIKRLGNPVPIPLDVRIISATNEDLKWSVGRGTFRKDLYYRLKVLSLRIPPLRERWEDIPQLFEHFLKKLSKQYNITIDIDPGIYPTLINYRWPGNVRELMAVTERTILNIKGDIVTKDLISTALEVPFNRHSDHHRKRKTLLQKIRSVQRKLILTALGENNYNIAHTARAENISPSTLKDHIHRLGLTGIIRRRKRDLWKFSAKKRRKSSAKRRPPVSP